MFTRISHVVMIAATTVVVIAARPGLAQDVSPAWRDFEAGRYQQVVDAAVADASPVVTFAAVLSAQKQGNSAQAREFAQRLAGRTEDDAWRHVGESARALLDGGVDEALQAAQRATAAGDGVAEAHYQLGLVQAQRQDWQGAAQAFDRATTLQPAHAYGYYYAGLMHYRANRPDLMAVRFERFLKLAPGAPERPEVQQIMRTVRGR